MPTSEIQKDAKRRRSNRTPRETASHGPPAVQRTPPVQAIRVLLPPPSVRRAEPDAAVTYSREERVYLAKLPERKRRDLMNRLESGDPGEPVEAPLRFRVLESRLPNKQEVLQRLRNGCEGAKFEQLLTNALRLPLGVYDPPPATENLGAFLGEARATMDSELYGQTALKDQTMRALGAWATNPRSGGLVLGLEGTPGIGKTSFAQALGKIMHRPLAMISLGGLNDVSVLTGHSYSYESSCYGQLAQSLMMAGTMSPVLVFDEVDKIGDMAKAQEIIALLIHLTDPNSNAQIQDRYFQVLKALPLDFSQACLVFTMNDASRVSPILRDRMTMVRMETPSTADKVAIAQNFIIPRELERVRMPGLKFDPVAVEEMVRRHASEPGVRGLARTVRNIAETINVTRRGGVLPSVKLNASDFERGEVSPRILGQLLPEAEETGVTHTMMYG